MEPLKTARGSSTSSAAKVAAVKPDAESKTFRLLNSALQSTRTQEKTLKSVAVVKKSKAESQQPTDQPSSGQKRSRHGDGQSQPSRSVENGSSKRQVTYQGQQTSNKPPPPSIPPPIPSFTSPPQQPYLYHPPPVEVTTTPLLETVKYFEEMNKVAKESGFQNAQEMLASQKEMMAMMSSGVAAPAPAPAFAPPPVAYGFGYNNDYLAG